MFSITTVSKDGLCQCVGDMKSIMFLMNLFENQKIYYKIHIIGAGHCTPNAMGIGGVKYWLGENEQYR